MDEPSPHAWEVFLDVYLGLPRQGPGDFHNAARALALCTELPPAPRVLDLGCGTRGQTLHLARLLGGSILALDRNPPAIARLHATIQDQGRAHVYSRSWGTWPNRAFPPRASTWSGPRALCTTSASHGP